MLIRLFLIILNICACTSSQRHRSFLGCYSTANTDDTCDVFKFMADTVLRIDYELKKSCSCENIMAIDRYDQNGYTRKIIFEGYKKDTVSIKIKHRVMYTSIDHIYKERKGLEDIKMLPFNLNTTAARYEIIDGVLYINIPYLDNLMDFCHDKINEEEIIVPMIDIDTSYDNYSLTDNPDKTSVDNVKTTGDNSIIINVEDSKNDIKDNKNDVEGSKNDIKDNKNDVEGSKNDVKDNKNDVEDNKNDDEDNKNDDTDSMTNDNVQYYDIDTRHS